MTTEPTTPMNTRDLVFIDAETSHVDPHVGEILEFAAARFRPVLRGHAVVALRHVDTLYVKTRMDHPERASAEALAVNGYTAEAWKRAVGIDELLFAFSEFMDLRSADLRSVNDELTVGAPLIVGQNPRFDWEFLREAYRRSKLAYREAYGKPLGLTLPEAKYTLDVAAMCWPLCVTGQIDRIRLESLCDWFGVSNAGAHGALADVRRTVAVYGKMLGLEVEWTPV